MNVFIFGPVNIAIARSTDRYTNGESSSSSDMAAQQQRAQITLGWAAGNAQATADFAMGLNGQLEFVRSREELHWCCFRWQFVEGCLFRLAVIIRITSQREQNKDKRTKRPSITTMGMRMLRGYSILRYYYIVASLS